MKEKQQLKFSVLIIIFGLLFTALYLADNVQLSRIREASVRIELRNNEGRQHLLSGWSGKKPFFWPTQQEALLKIPLSDKRTYCLTINAFSCSPPTLRDQRVEVHFNNVVLRRLKFKKIRHWQKFRVPVAYFFISEEENIVKFVFSQKPTLVPVVFDSLTVTDYVARIHKGITLYLFFDPPPSYPLERPYLRSKFQILGSFTLFSLLFLLIWRFFSKYYYRRANLKLSQTMKLDLLSFLPSLFILSFFALFSFFSRYQIVYSPRTFFILLMLPTFALKTWFVYWVITIKPQGIKALTRNFAHKVIFLLKKAIMAILTGCVEPIYQRLKVLRVPFIQYHKRDFSSALILDFIFLILLSMLAIIAGAPSLADFLAYPAYFLLLIGVIMKAIAFIRELRP